MAVLWDICSITASPPYLPLLPRTTQSTTADCLGLPADSRGTPKGMERNQQSPRSKEGLVPLCPLPRPSPLAPGFLQVGLLVPRLCFLLQPQPGPSSQNLVVFSADPCLQGPLLPTTAGTLSPRSWTAFPLLALNKPNTSAARAHLQVLLCPLSNHFLRRYRARALPQGP